MPGLDDRLRRDLDRLVRLGDSSGALNRVSARKRRAGFMRRVQVAGLVVAVVGASAGGTWALTRVFRDTELEPAATGPKVRNGKIAFVSDRDGNQEIYVMDPDGSNVVRLTNNPGFELDPAWSPDGSRIAFVSDRSGDYELHVMNADGTGVRRLTESSHIRPQAFAGNPDWSPDGQWIAFSARPDCRSDCPEGLSFAIFVVSPDAHRSTEWVNLSFVEAPTTREGAERIERDPTWSRDGERILFNSWVSSPLYVQGFDPGPSDPMGAYLMAADGTDRRPLLPMGDDDTSFLAGDIDWSPVDDRLLYYTHGNILVGVVAETSVSGIETLVEAGERETAREPAWSPDGTRIAFVLTDPLLPPRSDTEDIHVMNSNGSDQTNLTNHPANDFAPAWQPLPIGAPTVTPTVAPTGTPAPTLPPPTPPAPPQPSQQEFEGSFGPLCGFSGRFGDVDGDGKQDKTAVSFPKSGASCPAFPETGSWLVYVMWGNGATGAWPLNDCIRVCEAFGMSDLNGNDTDEFFLVVDSGAATVLLHVYQLPVGPQPKHPIEVAPPGADGYPANEPALFPHGGSVAYQDFITCNAGDGFHSLIATSAELDQEEGEWNVHETILSLERGAFTVVSTRNYQVAYDPTGEDPLPVPGDSCFALD